MRRFALTFVVCVLTAGFSGALDLVVPEPCALNETSNAPDGRCPPTCARCGCCAQPVVPAPLVVIATALVTRDELPMIDADLISPEPGEVLHVPRSLLA